MRKWMNMRLFMRHGEIDGIFFSKFMVYTGELMGNWWWCDVDYRLPGSNPCQNTTHTLFWFHINNGSWTRWWCSGVSKYRNQYGSGAWSSGKHQNSWELSRLDDQVQYVEHIWYPWVIKHSYWKLPFIVNLHDFSHYINMVICHIKRVLCNFRISVKILLSHLQ